MESVNHDVNTVAESESAYQIYSTMEHLGKKRQWTNAFYYLKVNRRQVAFSSTMSRTEDRRLHQTFMPKMRAENIRVVIDMPKSSVY
jgi:hypothetical protein